MAPNRNAANAPVPSDSGEADRSPRDPAEGQPTFWPPTHSAEADDDDEDDDMTTKVKGIGPGASPELFEHLDRVRRGSTAALPDLVEWLVDQKGPRADAVRDLLGGEVFDLPCPERWECVTTAEGPGWKIVRFRTLVRMVVTEPSRLASFFNNRRNLGSTRLEPSRMSAAEVRAAIERCRREVVFKLFRTSSWQLHNQRVIKSAPESAELIDVLDRYVPSPILVAALAATDPPRFAEIRMLVGRRQRLKRVGQKVMDELRRQGSALTA